MMNRVITNIDLILGNKSVNVSTLVTFGEFSVGKYYELMDEALTEIAQNKDLDTWAELEVCELLDQLYPMQDPITSDSVVTTYVGQV